MSLPEHYMTDPRVRDALETLVGALEDCLEDCDTALKSVLIVVRPENSKQAIAMIGCDCDGCKAALLASTKLACATNDSAKDDALRLIYPPITAVH